VRVTQAPADCFLKKKVTTNYSKTDETTAIGTTVSGETVSILAG
jgi:filamentous hemagglutinin